MTDTPRPPHAGDRLVSSTAAPRTAAASAASAASHAGSGPAKPRVKGGFAARPHRRARTGGRMRRRGGACLVTYGLAATVWSIIGSAGAGLIRRTSR